jgi:hypothetical protein
MNSLRQVNRFFFNWLQMKYKNEVKE